MLVISHTQRLLIVFHEWIVALEFLKFQQLKISLAQVEKLCQAIWHFLDKNFALQYVISSTTKLLDWFPLCIPDSSSRRRKISSQSKEVPTRGKKMWRLFSASNYYHFENRFLLFFSRWLPIDWFKVVQIVIVYQYPK